MTIEFFTVRRKDYEKTPIGFYTFDEDNDYKVWGVGLLLYFVGFCIFFDRGRKAIS